MGRVVSQDELILHRSEWKRNGKRVVFTSGCFDLLHPGHIRLIEQARSNGDVLVVGIESDASARRKQAAASPAPRHAITPAAERAEIVAALAAVDCAVEYDAASLRNLLERLAPDVVVKGGEPGSDQAAFDEDEASIVAGSKVVRVPLEPGHSTARLIERIKNLSA
ncbi:MAG: adenylyltransferase/cytidyltransferase family protein [Candidatus Acidiferrales bacterium]